MASAVSEVAPRKGVEQRMQTDDLNWVFTGSLRPQGGRACGELVTVQAGAGWRPRRKRATSHRPSAMGADRVAGIGCGVRDGEVGDSGSCSLKGPLALN